MRNTEELLKKIEERRGYLMPFHKFMAGEDPEYIELYENLTQRVVKDGALTAKFKELLRVAMNAAQLYEPGMKMHMKKAFALGATKAEAIEIIEVAGALFTDSLILGTKVLTEVLQEIGGEKK